MFKKSLLVKFTGGISSSDCSFHLGNEIVSHTGKNLKEGTFIKTAPLLLCGFRDTWKKHLQ